MFTSIFPRWKNLASWPGCAIRGCWSKWDECWVIELAFISAYFACSFSTCAMDTNTQIPRTLIPPACYPTIDTICKDLKLCSRRIRHALDSHADEFQLLQRIYYKNKNQHRVALFWRRVVEMRRYSERLNNSSIFSTLEQVRTLFFASEATQKCAILWCSWRTFTDLAAQVQNF
jgi:hypothetical protein